MKRLALDVGFSIAGIAAPANSPQSTRVFDRWIDDGMHAGMTYLERHRAGGRDPGALLPGVRSVLSVALNYYQEAEKEQRNVGVADGAGKFSIYVHGRDYHEVMDEMLATLGRRLESEFPGTRWTACADTRAVSDRSLAIGAGIGWLGKNSSVISPDFGSWIFLGELLTDCQLEPDSAIETLCADCRRCLDACPTGALNEPFRVDARKCISYLTIEHRGEIPAELSERIGNHVYGCDTCQSVCPFNGAARASAVFRPEDRSPLVDTPIDRLVTISDEVFRESTRDSAIRRCRAEGMRRNARVVSANLSGGNRRRSE